MGRRFFPLVLLADHGRFGGAFGKIVDSVVSDLILPVVGLVFGKLDFSNMFVALGEVPAGTALTRQGRRQLAAGAKAPSLISGWPDCASGAAEIGPPASAISSPPPRHWPDKPVCVR